MILLLRWKSNKQNKVLEFVRILKGKLINFPSLSFFEHNEC